MVVSFHYVILGASTDIAVANSDNQAWAPIESLRLQQSHTTPVSKAEVMVENLNDFGSMSCDRFAKMKLVYVNILKDFPNAIIRRRSL